MMVSYNVMYCPFTLSCYVFVVTLCNVMTGHLTMSMLRFFYVDPMVSGSNPPKLSFCVRRVASSLYFQAYESRGVVTSRGRAWTLLDKQKASESLIVYFHI